MSAKDDPKALAIFENHLIRRVWHEGRWWLSLVDVIAALTESNDPGQYWTRMKARVKQQEGIELGTLCTPFKLPALDGKMRLTDCADTEGILRIIQSIPSPKAQPFKLWLAQVGADVIEETENLDALFQEWRQHAIESYTTRGYSAEWAEARIDSIVVRNALTKEWSVRGISDKEYAILTDQLHMWMFGLSTQSHMGLKGFAVTRRGKRMMYFGNLRDAMTIWELTVTTFGENVTRGLHVANDSQGFADVTDDVDQAGQIAREHRELLEKQIGQPIVSPVNAIPATNTLWVALLPPAEKAP